VRPGWIKPGLQCEQNAGLAANEFCRLSFKREKEYQPLEKFMTHEGFVTYDEIITQTTAWMAAIRIVKDNTGQIKELDLKSYRQVLFIGCGSTYYLSLAAAPLFQSLTSVVARALPSSELLLFPESVYADGRVLLIAISRSGTTSETLRAVESFKAGYDGDVIVITNHSDSPLSKLGDIRLAINKGQERSVAQTRSFSSMLVAVTAMSALLGCHDFGSYQDILENSGKQLIENYQRWAEEYGRNHHISQVFFLGSGMRYGLASEVSLKLKEMSQTVTEPFHFLEFRHGPISMVDKHTLVIGMMSETAFDQEMEVIKDVQRLGVKTITIGEKDSDIEFRSGLPENTKGVLYLPVLQLFAYYRAVGFGKNPDKPRHLTAVVKLDLGK
jgi:glucosamine--fructose-6-phosphate aminotransferase (isomerizing)